MQVEVLFLCRAINEKDYWSGDVYVGLAMPLQLQVIGRSLHPAYIPAQLFPWRSPGAE
jgi:hypothetical protein